MTPRHLLALLLTGCAAAPLAPTPAPVDGPYSLPQALRTDPATLPIAPLSFVPAEPQVVVLANGLTIYLLEDRNVPLVRLRALVRLGALDDSPARVGLADVTWTTLQTGGAGKLGADALDRTLEDMAALLEGEVQDESAALGLEVRTVDVERGVRLFADLLRRPRFEPQALERVLDQARDSVRRRTDDAGHVAQAAFMQALWGANSPFAREPTLATLGRIGREDLTRLHAQAVVPAATRLLVSGDFEAPRMRALLEEAFGDWAGGKGTTRKLPPPPPAGKRRVLVIPTGGAQAKVRLGHLGPARHDPRELALGVLDAILGGSYGASRLYSEIRERRGLAYSVESLIGPGPSGGMVVLAADTRPESAREVIARALEVVDGVRGPKPPSAAEVALAKEAFVNAFVFRFDTASHALDQRATHDALGYPADHLRTLRARLQAITPEEVAAAARDVLHPDALQIVVVGDPNRMGDLSEFGPVETVLEAAEAATTPPP